jgi:hypothetical protein
MDATHIHLLLNHIPILGSLFGVLLLVIALIIKNKSVQVTALTTLVVVSLFSIPTYLSGDEAEHSVEHLSGVSEHELEEHEEHAELSLWLLLATGVVALASLASYKYAPHFTKWLQLLTVAVGVVGFLNLIPLALHGGKIMHSELRSSNSVEAADED